MSARRQQGLTLVELVIAIVVIGIAVTGVLAVYTTMVARSADPMIQEQAVAVAEAYLEEILLHPFTPGPGTGSRANFDDIFDYHGLTDSPPQDQNGLPIAALAGYQASVSVTASPAPALPGVPGGGQARIQVTVTHPATGITITLAGYRTDH